MKLESATLQQKVNYVRGRLYAAGAGEELVLDTKCKMFFHVQDADGTDLTGGRTIDAIVYWLDNRNDKKGE